MSIVQDYIYTPGTPEKTSARGRLTDAQRDFYEENGFIVIPRLIPEELLDKCQQRFLDIIDGKIERKRMTKMKDISLRGQKGISNERIYNKVQDLIYDDVFMEYIGHPFLLDYMENFTGPNIMAMHSMLINKPPDSGKLTSRHPWHQDLHYFPFRPANRVAASWTAMEHIDGQNGCLVAFPGTHRKGILYQHEYPQWEGGVNKAYHGIRGVDDQPKVELHMEKGDTVFFHPLLIHGSGPNMTQHFRKAISCHYASSECRYIDVSGTSQQMVADEIVEVVKKKRGSSAKEIKFEQIFQKRARCMRGQPAKL